MTEWFVKIVAEASAIEHPRGGITIAEWGADFEPVRVDWPLR